jgi:hypothetical protein
LNLYNSAGGAAEAVRRGADAAIGIQYDIDDSVAELFFGSFYAAWRRSGWDVLAGFRDAFTGLGLQGDKVRGTGIVLWTRRRLIGLGTAEGTRRRGRRLNSGTGPGGTGAPVASTGQSPTTGEHLPNEVANPAEHIAIDYQAPTALNYSMLHNDDRMVPRLVIRRQKPGIFRAIRLEVIVQAGAEQAAYRETVTLDDQQPKVDVHERVRVPLTSELTRRLDESLRSTIYVAVRWGRHVLLERTDPVSFMPVDEWRYDEMNARWLPSFIFPRDPIIRDVITAAQRYLVALRDDGAAGFDGYQSYDSRAEGSVAERARNVDAQVQAIWWALVNDYALSYINPPPSFSASAQRLRTPSETIGGKRGTCIDLALLLAACLEYVEIYPVIFMLTDHAFPGYWRCPESYEQLGKLLTASQASETDAQVPMSQRDNHGDPWMLGRDRFPDITRLVGQGHLMPIESVDITSRSGFWPAVDDGIANLRSRRQFDSLYDLRAARKKVTPLPIWSKRV